MGHLFLLEDFKNIGASGYCASTIKSCLMHVGLSRKLVRSSLKTPGSAALTASFQIWLCRESREWIIPNTADRITPTAMKSSIPKPPSHSNSKLPFQQDNNRKYGTNNCGLINKGNTCYVNASLQCLSTMVKFWSNFSAHTNKLPQFVAAFVKIMSLLHTSKGALDPSYFLKCLKQIISKAGNPAFDLFSQQDAAEILSYILEKLCGESIHVSESIRIHIRQTYLLHSMPAVYFN